VARDATAGRRFVLTLETRPSDCRLTTGESERVVMLRPTVALYLRWKPARLTVG
jgi:hypothetical protein